ncbi:MAG: hypothetical protein Q4D27_09910, partial [Coriobacteriia bacterium]|nr:hypothetical protein [Coriobacteriia bacterium]
RPANPRAARAGRFESTVADWKEPVLPSTTAPFMEPITADTTVPFTAIEADEPQPQPAAVDPLKVEPVVTPELPLAHDPAATVAMPAVPAAPETADEPLFADEAEDFLDEPDPVRRVKLPEINIDGTQDAPLANASAKARPHLSSMIPRIDVELPQDDPSLREEPAADSPSKTDRLRRLRTNLPSMSGTISYDPLFADSENNIVSQTGSFAAVSATGNIEPVGDELVQDVPPEEIYVDDVDDSQFGPAESFAAPEYVQMPEKRRGLFGRRRRRNDDVISPQEWLGVSDDFDARTVGKARGDWSSFRDNDARANVGNRNQAVDQPTMGWRADRVNPDPVNDYDTGLDSAFKDDEEDFLGEDNGLNNGRWMGGSFSGRRSTERDRYNVDDDDWAEFAEYADENYDENAFLDEDDYADADPSASGKVTGRLKGLTSRFSRKNEKQSDSRRESRSSRRSSYSPSEDDAWNVAAARAAARSTVVNVMDDPRVQEELGETYGFVDDPIANEVWFVALGAGLSGNAGMNAFLEAHTDELRGAVVISLEGMGDGELVGMASEGVLRQYKPTTRMKRFLRNAGQATGVRVGQAKMNWRDSAATVAMRKGMPTITVAGVEGNVPARFGSSDDVVEHLNEDTLKQRVNFILELLRTI